jgi:hypothetical protein
VLDLGSNGLRLATGLGMRSFLGMGLALGFALGLALELVTATKPPGQGSLLTPALIRRDKEIDRMV